MPDLPQHPGLARVRSYTPPHGSHARADRRPRGESQGRTALGIAAESSSRTSPAFCSAPGRAGARFAGVVRNIAVPNRIQNTSRDGSQRLLIGSVSSRLGNGLSSGEKRCVSPMLRGTLPRQGCGSRQRNAASAALTHFGKKVNSLGLVLRHYHHLTHCAPMTSCSSSVTSSRLARPVIACPARIRRNAWPTTYARVSCRRSRR